MVDFNAALPLRAAGTAAYGDRALATAISGVP
jgi:hypothetical protein